MIGSIRTSEPVFHYRLPRLQSVDGRLCPDRLSYPEENRQSSHLKLSNLKGRKKGPPEFYSALFQCRAAVFDRLCFCHYHRYRLWRCVIVPVVHFRRIGCGVYRAVVNSEQYHRQLFDLFVFPYRVGDRIKVVDKDEDISGEIQEISMFHVLIKHDNGNLITYPNNQILQKAVLKLAKEKAKPEEPKTTSRIYTRRKK